MLVAFKTIIITYISVCKIKPIY